MSIDGENWGLVGHEWAVALLCGRLKAGRPAHATLITGPQGVGKNLLATRLAQALCCTGPGDPPCGQCRHCTLIGQAGHPDLLLIEKEGTSIKIEAVRAAQQMLALAPIEARQRIAIFKDMQDATPQAQDSLLKTLEEPPGSAKLILTAVSADALLPTIASRCAVIGLRRVPAPQIAAWLARQVPDLPPGQADLLAGLAGGRPGWAINAAADPAVLQARAATFDALISALRQNRSGRFSLAEELATRKDLPQVLDLWQSAWRDALLLAAGSPVTPLHVDRSADLNLLAGAGTHAVFQALTAVRHTRDALDRNANTRLALDVLLLSLPYL